MYTPAAAAQAQESGSHEAAVCPSQHAKAGCGMSREGQDIAGRHLAALAGDVAVLKGEGAAGHDAGHGCPAAGPRGNLPLGLDVRRLHGALLHHDVHIHLHVDQDISGPNYRSHRIIDESPSAMKALHHKQKGEASRAS